MDIDVFEPRHLPTVMRVLRSALAPEAPLDATQRRFLATYARITRQPAPEADPALIAPAAVNLPGAHQRKRLVQLAAIAALLSRPLDPHAVAYVQALAAQLAVHDGVLAVLEALLRGRRTRVRLLAMRRTLGALLGEARRAQGWRGVARFLAAMFLNRGANPALQARYDRLADLPEGTLGRTYWQHMKAEGFGFPGAPGGIAESVAYHDVAHVLAGHEATPLGEIQQGSFQGGNRRRDGFFFVQFVLLQFHHGIKASPKAPSAEGHFDPERVLWAIHRGAQARVDMTDQWDFWPLMALPLEQARERVGLLPAWPADAAC